MNLLMNIVRSITHRGSVVTENFMSDLVRLVSSVNADYLSFNARQVEEIVDSGRGFHYRPAPVIYIPIFEDHIVSMGIFFLRFAHSIIPLHDHPGINGCIKVIHGNAKVTQISAAREPEAEPNLFRISEMRNLVVSQSDNSVLRVRPDKFNYHEIVPVSGGQAPGSLAFFDVLFPPYDPEDGRDCNYYELCHDSSFIRKLPNPPTLEIFDTEFGPYFGPSCIHY